MTIARRMQQAAAGSAGAGPAPSGWTNPDLANASYDGVSFSVAGQDGGPTDIIFNPDGTKMYILGFVSDTVYQYSLSTGFDLSTASYDSVSFSVAGQDSGSQGIAFNLDGTKMYMVGSSADSIYQYTLSTGFDLSTASYDNVSFSVAGQDTTPYSIAFNHDGTKMYMVGNATDTVYQYSLSTGFDLSTASYDSVSFSVADQDTLPISMVFNPDGTKMYILGFVSDTVYQYSLSTGFDLSTASYDSVSFSVAGQESSPRGLGFSAYGTKMYIVGSGNDTIYQYSTAAAAPAEWTDPDLANASYDSVSFDIGLQEASPESLFFKPDGTKMYVMGISGDDVNEYDLSTAWDITTASFLQLFSVAAQEDAPRGLFFKPDGTKMYVIGTSGDDVTEYNLSTAWDVSTASFLQSFSVAGQETIPTGLFFKSDGTKMYVMGVSLDEVHEYDLSTAWDVSAASFLQSFSVAGQETTPRGLFFNPDGTKMYVLGTVGDDVNEYDLSTAWDVSAASFLQSFSVAGQEISPTTLFFKSDGSKMYVVGTTTDTIYQYSTA